MQKAAQCMELKLGKTYLEMSQNAFHITKKLPLGHFISWHGMCVCFAENICWDMLLVPFYSYIPTFSGVATKEVWSQVGIGTVHVSITPFL
jgi:hypothetical protein